MPFYQNSPFMPVSKGSFSQGFNKIMRLYGAKMIAEKEKRQQEQFDKQFKLQEERYGREKELHDLTMKTTKAALERKTKLYESVSKLNSKDPNYKEQALNLAKLFPEDAWSIQVMKDAADRDKEKRAKQTQIDKETRAKQTQIDLLEYKEGLEEIEAVNTATGGAWKGSRNEYATLVKNSPPGTYKRTIDGKPVEKMDTASLTMRALRGDKESLNIIEKMQADRVEVAKAQGENAMAAKLSVIDKEGLAEAIVTGRETIDYVKNTFGVAVQEAVRSEVLKKDPTFNFLKPRVKVKAIQTTLSDQYKRRGAMGSFVKNINKQIDRVEGRSTDITKRVGVRALDLPYRELKTRFVGSGHENVLEAYMREISAEISKLSQGAAASIQQLSDTQQAAWNRIHDPNLSLKELQIVLEETREMANMRINSTDEEIKETMDQLDNIRMEKGLPPKKKSRFKIIKVQ